MKVGVISDTHISGPRETLPDEIFEHFKGVDLILHAGDLVDMSVIDQLNGIAPVKAVYGNMDPMPVRQSLQKKELIEIEGHRIGLIHGSGPPWGLRERINGEFIEDDPEIIIYGHSHAPETIKSRNGVLYINPGSPTDGKSTRINSVVVMEITPEDVKAEIKYL